MTERLSADVHCSLVSRSTHPGSGLWPLCRLFGHSVPDYRTRGFDEFKERLVVLQSLQFC